MKSEYGRYRRYKSKLVYGNVGLWLMLVFDVVFFVFNLLSGFSTVFLVLMCVGLGAELLVILLLLPKPMIHLDFTGALLPALLAFAVMPVACIEWGLELTIGVGTDGLPPAFLLFGWIAVARILLYLSTFLFPRLGEKPALVLTVFTMLVSVAGFVVPPAVDFDVLFFERPVRYVMEDDDSYKIDKVYPGLLDNVVLRETYGGYPVRTIGTGAIRLAGVRTLIVPASVTSVETGAIADPGIERLVFASQSVLSFAQDAVDCPSLTRLEFPSLPGLPRAEQGFLRETRLPLVISARPAAIDAMRASPLFSAYYPAAEPIVAADEYYVMYYTDCLLPEGGSLEQFTRDIEVLSKGAAYQLTEPDLHAHGYEFIGWFDSRDYTQKVERVDGQNSVKLYAKFLKRYGVTLDAGAGSLADGAPVLYYHIETPALTLPAAARPGYTFVGWFDAGAEQIKGQDVEKVAGGETGDRSLVARYNRNYALTYDTQGVTVDLPESYHEWSDDVALPALGKTGYTFMGWFADSLYTEPVEVVRADAGRDQELYAKFNLNYSITVYGTGNFHYLPSYYHVETPTIPLPQISRTGYLFGGWFDNESFTGQPKTAIEKGTTGDLEFYVKWTPVTYTVAYEGGAGSTGSTTSDTFAYDAENTLAANGFGKTGYLFGGWRIAGTVYPAGACSVNFSSTQGATVTATAVWTPVTYTVRYDGGAGSTGTMESNTFTYDAENTLAANGFGKAGYLFGGWRIAGTVYPAGACSVNFSSTQGATVTATAVWTPVTYTVEYEGGAGATGVTANNTFTYDAENTLAANGFGKTGYLFGGWRIAGTIYPAGSCAVNFSSTQGATVTATAVWTPVTYTIAFASGGGTGTPPAGVTFTYDAPNVLPQTSMSKTGYTFAGWSIGGVTYRPGETSINFASTQGATVTATAVWEPVTYTVRYAGGEGATGTAPVDATFTYDATNTIAANTLDKEGYRFAGWNIGGVTYQPGETSVNFASTQGATVAATAVWEPVTYTVRYMGGEGATGTAPVDATFTYDATNTIAANTFDKEGYTFAGWSISGVTYQPRETSVNFASTQGATVTATAVWEPVTYTVRYAGGEGATGTAPVDATFTYDATNTIAANTFDKEGYTFAGWRISGVIYQPGETSVNFASTQGAMVTATAVWEPL